MLVKLKENIKKWNEERQRYPLVKKQLIKNCLWADRITIDDRTLVLAGEYRHTNGIEYGLFVDRKDLLNMIVSKTIFEDNKEFWAPIESDEEFDEIFLIFIKKYYPELVEGVEDAIREQAGKRYKEDEIRKEYGKLTKLLIEKKLTISTMESATSGQIASLITDCEGSSAVFPGGFVTYCNEAKIRYGVSKETIEIHTVYSEEVAREMALNARKAYGTDIGIGVTGTMGNVDPNNSENSVPGKVYFAIAKDDQVNSHSVDIPLQSSRLMYKLAVAKEIYDVLTGLLEEPNVPLQEDQEALI